MDSERKLEIEQVKLSLQTLNQEEARLLKELEMVRARKIDATEKLKKLSDDTGYQQDMLEMLYAQRRKN